jgi:hypothetical protein
MIIYYILTSIEGIGSTNKYKIEMMYKGYKIYECDISDFSGYLLSSEYID